MRHSSLSSSSAHTPPLLNLFLDHPHPSSTSDSFQMCGTADWRATDTASASLCSPIENLSFLPNGCSFFSRCDLRPSTATWKLRPSPSLSDFIFDSMIYQISSICILSNVMWRACVITFVGHMSDPNKLYSIPTHAAGKNCIRRPIVIEF